MIPRIKYLVMDVDGTLTDGKIYMGNDGEVMKAFNIKDGCGIHDLLPDAGITPLIITGRKSKIVENRCKEIGITHFYQGVSDKVAQLRAFIEEHNCTLQEVAYAGDDINDLACMRLIKENGGVIGVPSNACWQVKQIADYVSQFAGGDGAVRDFVEYLVAYNKEQHQGTSLEERCMEAIAFLSKLKEEDLAVGRHDVDDNFYYSVQEYETKVNPSKHFESHCKYVDVQMLLSGEETLQVVDINRLRIEEPYDEVKERILYYATLDAASIVLRPGTFVVLYPKDAHRTIALNGIPSNVIKVVGKLKI
ncbi:3-deoxy-D-manno-octulosonate 8-phosphate phosphatase (KDO 8-P phosphatase) [Xylanibacter ruminicola]|uniref:YhcH/YjgK/YiaL family protein n=1 Tax=Xylanibacter ruminicola TaxID=839 RepID=UPI0008E003DB|nr:YhcH/YjgK/YiaL family protein [Xylanibacter ruminicola]SFC56144.1 3-deoxy-D-manno-octulosonate 8-phosphate phosphatase (KDO 8-P phosphatase) [Xylanibacter ruminicola]